MNKNYLFMAIAIILLLGGLFLWQRQRTTLEAELNKTSQELEALNEEDFSETGLDELSPGASPNTSTEVTKELQDIEKDLNSLYQSAFEDDSLNF